MLCMQDTVTSILYLPSRGVLATGSLDMHVKLWDVTSAKNRCLSSIVPDDLFDQDPVKGLACDPQVGAETRMRVLWGVHE